MSKSRGVPRRPGPSVQRRRVRLSSGMSTWGQGRPRTLTSRSVRARLVLRIDADDLESIAAALLGERFDHWQLPHAGRSPTGPRSMSMTLPLNALERTGRPCESVNLNPKCLAISAGGRSSIKENRIAVIGRFPMRHTQSRSDPAPLNIVPRDHANHYGFDEEKRNDIRARSLIIERKVGRRTFSARTHTTHEFAWPWSQ
jgi:hypothetical protein